MVCVHLMGEENGKGELGGATCTASQLANEKELMRTVKPGEEGLLRWKFWTGFTHVAFSLRTAGQQKAAKQTHRQSTELTSSPPFLLPLSRRVIIIEAV